VMIDFMRQKSPDLPEPAPSHHIPTPLPSPSVTRTARTSRFRSVLPPLKLPAWNPKLLPCRPTYGRSGLVFNQAPLEYPRGKPFIVLELAVAASAPFIITHNLGDFQGSDSMGVRAITPATALDSIRS
jgi:hypothetical protein